MWTIFAKYFFTYTRGEICGHFYLKCGQAIAFQQAAKAWQEMVGCNVGNKFLLKEVKKRQLASVIMAFTHPSYANENELGKGSYQRLEYLGIFLCRWGFS